MATKSILKIVHIDPSSYCKFVTALENAGTKKGKEVTISKRVQNISEGKIKEMFER